MPDYLTDPKYAAVQGHWDDAEYLLEFHYNDQGWYYKRFARELSTMDYPNGKRDCIWRYAKTSYKDIMFSDPSDKEVMDQIEKIAEKGRAIKDAEQECKSFPTKCLAALVLSKWKGTPCLASLKTHILSACLKISREVARDTSVSLSTLFGGGAAGAGAPPGKGPIMLTKTDVKDGKFAALFTLGHEFGHKVDLAVRSEDHIDFITAIFPDFIRSDPFQKEWAQPDALKSLEYFADGYSTVLMRYGMSLASKDVLDGARACLENTFDDGTHPSGEDRLKGIQRLL